MTRIDQEVLKQIDHDIASVLDLAKRYPPHNADGASD